MKTLNYLAVLMIAIIFSASFIAADVNQPSDRTNCTDCSGSVCSANEKNSSGGNSISKEDCYENGCTENCSYGTETSLNESGGINNNDQSVVVNKDNDKNCSGNCTKESCK
ncbi:MAG: hypothetical protein ABI462_02335 [Ignavibacteria bacterium]